MEQNGLFSVLNKEVIFMKRFLLGMALSFVLSLGAVSVYADDKSAISAEKTIVCDNNVSRNVNAFIYKGEEYFSLRDVCSCIGFSVNWDSLTQTTVLEKGLTENGAFLEGEYRAIPVYTDIYVYGNKNTGVPAINIMGHNYFKLSTLSDIIDFDWNSDSGVISIRTEMVKDSIETKVKDIPFIRVYLNDSENQCVIDDTRVRYMKGSMDITEAGKYIKENINADFAVEDYSVKENEKFINWVFLRFVVDGIDSNFGYNLICFDGNVRIINEVGKFNEDFDVSVIKPVGMTDEEIKAKAVELDNASGRVDEQRVYKYFDMNDLKFKAQVETVYEKTGLYCLEQVFEI